MKGVGVPRMFVRELGPQEIQIQFMLNHIRFGAFYLALNRTVV